MDLGIQGRTALITGASRGIGRAVALRLAKEGARVVLCARNEEPLLALLDEIVALGAEGLSVPCDVTDPGAPDYLLSRLTDGFPGVDILVNNAGAAIPRKLLDTVDSEWISGLELNLLSAVRFTRACLPWMLSNHWGRVINVSSTTAKLADPAFPIYGAAKAALLNFSKTVAAAYAADGVRCNCVLPGITRTELVEANLESASAATGVSEEEVMKRMIKRWPIPAGRIGEPEEIADAIAFLASANAGWITGTTLAIDGGTIPVAG